MLTMYVEIKKKLFLLIISNMNFVHLLMFLKLGFQVRSILNPTRGDIDLNEYWGQALFRVKPISENNCVT